jgi:hypothetical protein
LRRSPVPKPATARRKVRDASLRFRVDPDIRAVVERVAEREERTMSAVIHRILAAWAKTVEAEAR